MALWEPVEFPPPRPGQATVVPALPQGPSLGVLAEVMKAAGIPQAPSTPQVAAPAPVPATPMAEPPAPSAWPTDGVQPPPVNNDFFGRVLRGVMDANPILDAVPPDIKERALAIFRLYGDKAWRDNTVLGSTVSNIEAGGPKTVGQSWEAQRTASLMRNPEQPGILTEPTPAQPNAPAATDERSIARRRDYEINAAEKKSQLNALGPLSPIEQVTALLSSLVGSAGSPEIAIGPGAAAYAKAGTVGKMALGAGTNAAVVGLTDPANQISAVQRGDRKDYSPVEHAMATGGAAILGAAIPALGALFRRLGAIRPEAPPRADGPPALDGEVLPPVTPAPEGAPRVEPPRAPAEAPSVKLRQPQLEAPDAAPPPAQRALPAPEGKPDVRYTEDGIPIIRITPEKKAPPAPEQPATRPAIEAPPKAAAPAPARPEAPVETAKNPAETRPFGPAVIGNDGKLYAGKPGEIHADIFERHPELDWTGKSGFVDAEGKFLTRQEAVSRLPADSPARRVMEPQARAEAPAPVREPSLLSLDTPAPKPDAAGMQTVAKEVVPNSRPVFTGNATDTKSAQVIPGPVRAAEQPPDIPDFLRRTPKPAEKPVEVPAPKTGNQEFDAWAEGMQTKIAELERATKDPALEYGAPRERQGALRDAARAVSEAPPTGPDLPPSRMPLVAKRIEKMARDQMVDQTYRGKEPPIAKLKRVLDEKAPEAPKGPRLAVDNTAPAAPAAGVPPKHASARGLKNQPISVQAAHHREKNPKTYRQSGPTDERGLAEYFKPGRLVPSYGDGVDRIVSFDWNGGQWRARVRAVDPKTGEPKPHEGERAHSTPPTWQIVERADTLNAPKPDAAAPAAKTHDAGKMATRGKETTTNGRPEIEWREPHKFPYEGHQMQARYVVTAEKGAKAGDKSWVVERRDGKWHYGREVGDRLTPGVTKKEAMEFARKAAQEEIDAAGREGFAPTKYTHPDYVRPGDPVLVKHGEAWRLGHAEEIDHRGVVTRADVGGEKIDVKHGESARFGHELRSGYETLMKRHGDKTWATPQDAKQTLVKWRNKTLSGVKEKPDAASKPDAAAPPPREPPPPETPRAAETGAEAPKPDHPFTAKSDKPTEMHAGIGSAMLAKAVGPEAVGAVVGGLVDHWERYGTPGISWQGALAGAATVAALRHRLPGVGKSVFGKGSYATSALKAGGDLMAKTRVGRWFHPTMGLPADLWERVVVKTKLETRNMQDDLLKIAKHVREEFTPAERALMSDWIEKAEQAQHGLTGFQAASARVRAQAEALAAHADDLGQKLADVGMIDRNSLLAEGTYLHRYYMDKQAADPGFREAAKRMQATASYAMRRGEQIEVKGAEKFKVGDKAVQWTNVQSGNVVYKTHGWNGGPEWFQSKEFTVESINGAKMVLHRDYTPAERDAMGEIRDANYRFTMGSMEASRDLALGRMFKDIAADPRWASATDPGGWKQVPKTNAQGTTVRKWGALAGMYVDPKVWSALDVIRKPWTSEEWGVTGRVVKGYLKALGAWKVGKTAYNPATHFNNLMGNTSLAMLTGEVTPTWVMRGIGELRRGGPAVEEARRAGLSLGREANLGDELTNIKVDVGLATGVSQVGTWGKLLDWYSNNALVRGYQHEDAIFKMGAYMRRRAAGETPEEAVKNVHKVFFDYGDVPLGVQAMRDSYSPFFTYTYKYGQVALREMAERPWRYAAAFGALSAIDMMSYGLLYGDKAKSAADYEQATMPKWLEGRSGFGAQKAITLPFKQKDTVTGEDRSLKLNTRYMVPGGDLLDFTANGNFGPAIFPQALGNTILGGNPLVNFIYGIANGKDSFFDRPIQPYPSTGLWSVGERPTSEILANWGALARFAAFQSLPPMLTSIPDKLGQAAVGEGLIDKKSGFADFMGWTGEDFAGRQKTVLQAIGSALGIKVEDINHAEQERFRESERLRDVRESKAAMRRAYNNESMTESQRLGREKSLEDSIERMDREAQRIDDLRRKAGR